MTEHAPKTRSHQGGSSRVELTGKRTLVTGGARGIGEAVARGLAGQGARRNRRDEGAARATAEDNPFTRGTLSARSPLSAQKSGHWSGLMP
jgi:NAD(P)-dependent dehydrogenase (short-subunit alcohol dehydrogenase family)